MPYKPGDFPPTRSEHDLGPDPEYKMIRESKGGKVAMFAIAIALVLGAVFYGLNDAKTGKKQDRMPASISESKK